MSPDPAPPRYRRRNRWPIAVVVLLLLAGAVVVWAQILKPEPAEATGCNEPLPVTTSQSAGGTGSGAASGSGPGTTSSAPTGTETTATTTASSATGGSAASGPGTASGTSTTSISTTLGEFTDPNMLASTRPADPGRVPLRVLNASNVTGQAKTVTDELRSAGFSSIREQANDPLYQQWDLRCYGEIRFGYAGLAEARTVLLVAPCAQLVLDQRSDNSVDLALGKLYQVEPVSDEVRGELTRIANAAAPPPVIEGQTVSVRAAPTIPPLPDRSSCPNA